MPFNGSGVFTLVSGNPVVTNTVISSTVQNNTTSDFATGFTTCLTKDGQTTPTANLPMGNYKHTGAAAASAAGQYLLYGQNSAVLGSLNCTGTQTMTGAAANVAVEVDVASATTTDIGGAASNQIRITGTTTITSFGTTYTGPRYIRFAGILTLTHASSLVLPGGANITTAAGDTCIAMPLPSSAGWYVSTYQKASGAVVAGGSITTSGYTQTTDRLLGRTTASTGAIEEITVGANLVLSSGSLAASLAPITNSISGDVSLSNTGQYFTGPTIAQGSVGTWFASGSVTLHDTGAAAIMNVKLWDGTTVIASAQVVTPFANYRVVVSLSGYIATPAGNIRISVNDATSTAGVILYNQSGNSKDSTITAIRVA